MNNKIDCHILTQPTDNSDWFQQCLQSIEKEPINLFIEPGIEGNIGLARMQAYAKGEAPYVSYVDPDDVVVSGAFQKCLEVLEDDVDKKYVGAFTLRTYMSKNGEVGELLHSFEEWTLEKHASLETPYSVAQLFVLRREVITDIFKRYSDMLPKTHTFDRGVALLASLYGDWKAINYVGYRWRIHNQSNSAKQFAEVDRNHKKFYQLLDPIMQLLKDQGKFDSPPRN